MNNLPTCLNIRYFRLVAKDRGLTWKDVNLPQELQAQCIAYCIREGGTFLIGRPTSRAIVFVFPDGTVYDIPMLLHFKQCWRTVSAKSLEWIRDQINPIPF